MRHSWIRAAVIAALVLVAVGGITMATGASTPGADTIAVPGAAGQTATVTWTGTIPPASVHANDCNSVAVGTEDQHDTTITAPAAGYGAFDAEFKFTITWTPVTPTEDTADEVLTVNAPGGSDPGDTAGPEVGSSDHGTTTEEVVAHNLSSGTYQVLACGFANALPQPYTGTLTITTKAKAASTAVASVDAQGLAFSAAVPSDPQRDEAEPLIVSDADGVLYTCGPTGFSNAAEYAEVSTDGGKQFHLMGTPPRGQQGAGGGGDCALATGIQHNAQGHYEYAYSGLGALTGFTTSRSPDNGHTIANAGPNGNGVPGATTSGALADRQWMTFTDDHTVLLSYNQQHPRNVVVQTSTDGGLTYSATSSIAAPNPDFPGPMHYIPSSHTVVMPWTRGESINLAVSHDGGATWFDCNVAKGPKYVGAGTAGFATADVDQAGNVYVAWTDATNYNVWMSSVSAAKLAQCDQPPYGDLTVPGGLSAKGDGSVAGTDDGIPSTTLGTTPSQVDRDGVRTTVFPWIAAGGAPGRVAVAFYGSEQDGDPNTGSFKAAWNVYVNQSLNALEDGTAQFSQVQATTHPFHYDSICLNGLGCDLSVPKGDRSLADFFAITYNQNDGKLSVVFDRGNKKPDDEAGYVATPMVVTQTAGPSNGGSTISGGDATLRSATTDATGDALTQYSAMATGTEPPPPPTTAEPAADFTSAAISPDAATGGFTVTLHIADLSAAALSKALADSHASSLDYVWRFTNGWQDSGASASWSPATGWTFGFDDYSTGGAQCGSSGDKCVIWPQATKIAGSVNQGTGTIILVVPAAVLHPLTGADAYGRPMQGAAAVGSRFYDGTAFSFANAQAAPSPAMSWMEQLDNTPAMDFLLPAVAVTGSGGGGGGGGSSSPGQGGGTGNGGTSNGNGNGGTSNGNGTGNKGGGVKGSTKTVTHMVVARGTVRASLNTTTARAWINRKSVLYVDRKAKLRFTSTKVTSVAIRGHSATLRGVGVRNGVKNVRFRVVLVAGKPATLHVWFGKYVRSGRLVRGTAIVR